MKPTESGLPRLLKLGLSTASASLVFSIAISITDIVGYTSFINSFPIAEVLLAVTTTFVLVLAMVYGDQLVDNTIQKERRVNRTGSEPQIVIRLLKRIIPKEEQENIAGDLLEEFNEFPSRFHAHLWLYKQVLKSALPLIYNNFKKRLASYFGEQVR